MQLRNKNAQTKLSRISHDAEMRLYLGICRSRGKNGRCERRGVNKVFRNIAERIGGLHSAMGSIRSFK